MITETEYRLHRNRIDAYHRVMRELYPNQNGFSPDEIANIVQTAHIGRAPTNEERSAVEVYEFLHNPPEKYFVYINRTKREATTWTGEKLGTVGFGTEYRDNFGGKRVPITVYAINGAKYHGTYYASSGDYARIKMSKRSRATRVLESDVQLLAELVN
jgi:hypothetical protein